MIYVSSRVVHGRSVINIRICSAPFRYVKLFVITRNVNGFVVAQYHAVYNSTIYVSTSFIVLLKNRDFAKEEADRGKIGETKVSPAVKRKPEATAGPSTSPATKKRKYVKSAKAKEKVLNKPSASRAATASAATTTRQATLVDPSLPALNRPLTDVKMERVHEFLSDAENFEAQSSSQETAYSDEDVGQV